MNLTKLTLNDIRDIEQLEKFDKPELIERIHNNSIKYQNMLLFAFILGLIIGFAIGISGGIL